MKTNGVHCHVSPMITAKRQTEATPYLEFLQATANAPVLTWKLLGYVCLYDANRLEEAETAIKYDPNNESAWSYKTNLLIEEAKIADMNGEADKKAQYTRQAEVAQKRASELAEERRKKEEAAEKAASPTP